MKIPGLGEVEKDEESGWYLSDPVRLAVFDDEACSIVLEGYDEDTRKDEFHAAIDNLRAASFDVMRAAQEHVYRYYQKMNAYWKPGDDGYVEIAVPADVWDHVTFGGEPIVSRRSHGDKAVYVSMECNCDWEPEHGLQIVLRNGNEVCKVGPYDGHLTNSDAYADASLEKVIYR